MKRHTWNVYEAFGLDRAGSGGELTAWSVETPAATSPSRRRPAVLILPGGRYEHVSPRESEPVALRFLAHGWVPFVLDYSTAPSRFPVALREAALAMRLIRREGRALEVDPDQAVCVGFSAGGHLAGTLATLFDAPEVADIAPPEVVRPDALGLCYPVAVSHGRTHEASFVNLCGEDDGLRARLSLDRLARGDMPPTYLWCTRDDASVPCRNTLLLAQAMAEAGADFICHVYRHGAHGLSTADVQSFPAGGVPPHSPELDSWPEDMMTFFAASGLGVRDA